MCLIRICIMNICIMMFQSIIDICTSVSTFKRLSNGFMKSECLSLNTSIQRLYEIWMSEFEFETTVVVDFGYWYITRNELLVIGRSNFSCPVLVNNLVFDVR